jgi:hypothetical protein
MAWISFIFGALLLATTSESGLAWFILLLAIILAMAIFGDSSVRNEKK